MKKIIFYIALSSLVFLSLFQGVFGSSGDIQENPKTIRELQESAASLKKQQLQLEFKWNTFQIGNETLKDFIIDLNNTEFNELTEIISLYEAEKTQREEILKRLGENSLRAKEISNELLLLKKDFYTNLIPYIQQEKLDEYKNYISNDVQFNEKSKIVDREIKKIEEIKQERIEVIQEKIEDNNRELRKSIEEKLRVNVKQKLDIFIQQERFQSLSRENKILVFTNLKDKISEFKNSYTQQTETTTSFMGDEKIVLLEIVEDIIDSYISDWK